MDRDKKAVLEKIVDLALDVLMSRDSDAGWQNSGILGRLQDCGGVLPKGQASDVAVWKKGWLLGNWKPKHRQALALLDRLSPDQRQAVLIHRAYLKRTTVTVDPETGERALTRWTLEKMAGELGISVSAFRSRVERGYELLSEMLQGSAKSTA
ncbi:hypothetical protein AU15_07775 [Marinobacter salarius]|uniref:Uncharacterized protein n=1 Tax=Marinobacter salarius TaxID=1420917 RepID=W5YW65_9GAMM|nr:hypothetical protein AU15_07775 [Marinobacter salarius]